jgi:hypothetical protein
MGSARGFDAFVGNPPFAGKNTLVAAEGEGYTEWLKTIHDGSHGNSDLVAHFFRRAFDLLRRGGALGLVATNTIAQGDTRSTGLRWICKHGGVIYNATRRYKWPGLAAVVVSIVHVEREPSQAAGARLDAKPVDRISAFLFHQGGDDDPVPLAANANKSFIGNYINGAGFTFDDAVEGATPIAEMNRLVAANPASARMIFPYIGGEEVLTHPEHKYRRFVINFGALEENQARASFPELFGILERKVKPQRLNDKRESYRRYWWQHAEKRGELAAAVAGLGRFLFHPNLSVHLAFVFLANGTVVAAPHNVFAFDSDSAFATLQSRCHEVWARFFGSSMKDDLRYTPSDCFETYPFPLKWTSSASVDQAGRAYHDFRASLMVENGEGLTDTYNRFHAPDERSPGILELRRLHDAMDRTVLDAYGWTDLHPICAFILDYGEDDAGHAEIGAPRKKKKPWRYRWPDDQRDEVLARLLALNAERAAEERRLGAEASLSQPKKAKPVLKRQRRTRSESGKLF